MRFESECSSDGLSLLELELAPLVASGTRLFVSFAMPRIELKRRLFPGCALHKSSTKDLGKVSIDSV